MSNYTRENVMMLKHELDQQLQDYDVFDRKAYFLFGAIMIVISILVGRGLEGMQVHLYFLGMLLMCIALLLTLLVIMPRKLSNAPNPKGLLQHFESTKNDKEEREFLCSLSKKIVEAYEDNKIIRNQRYRNLRKAIILCITGVSLVLLSLIVPIARSVVLFDLYN